MPDLHDISSDDQALDRFVRERSDGAFAILVERYADMVFGTALRKTNCVQLSEEVAQNVFALLARKAASLRSAKALGVWLHRAAIMETRNLLRRELNHRRKMERYSKTLGTDDPHADDWAPATPHLDEAIDRLPESDRRMIMLRFFEGRSFREIGERLGKSEDTCQKRASRAVEKLARQLRRRGLVIPIAVVASGLAAQLSKAAPASVKASLAKGAAAAGVGQFSFTTIIAHIMNYTNWKAAAALAIFAAIPLTIQWSQNKSLASEIDSLESGRTGSKVRDRKLTALPDRTSRQRAEKDRPAGRQAIAQLRVFLQQAESAPHRRSSASRLVEHILTLPPETMEEAHELLSGSPLFSSQSPMTLALVTAFYDHWATTDPSTALEKAFIHGYERSSAIEAVFSGWARTDPQGAIDALLKERSRIRPEQWSNHVESTLRTLALENPEATAKLVVESSLPHKDRDKALSSIGGYWADQNPDEALEWVATLSEGSRAWHGAFSSAVITIAKTQPKQAAELTSSIPKGSEQVQLFVAVQEMWWAVDPANSEAWYRSHGLRPRPPGPDDTQEVQGFSIMPEEPKK